MPLETAACVRIIIVVVRAHRNMRLTLLTPLLLQTHLHLHLHLQIVGIKFLRNTVVKFIKMILRSPPIEVRGPAGSGIDRRCAPIAHCAFFRQLNNVSNDELMRNRNNLSDLCTAIMMQLVANVEQYPQYVE